MFFRNQNSDGSPVIDSGSEFASGIFTMAKTTFTLMFGLLFATFVFAQTEEPDWQDVMTHRMDSGGSRFPKKAADAALKAILYNSKLPEGSSVIVTNFVEFCDEVDNKQCFAAALYTVDLSINSSDEIQCFVWLDRVWISNDRFEYRKLWEYRTQSDIASGSLLIVDPPSPSFFNSCLLVKSADNGNAYHAVTMRIFCLNRSYYPEILLEYTGDHTGESTGQDFQKSILIFRDIDDDGINEIIVDSIEGYQPGWAYGDQKFQITMHRTVYYYDDQVRKFLAVVQ